MRHQIKNSPACRSYAGGQNAAAAFAVHTDHCPSPDPAIHPRCILQPCAMYATYPAICNLVVQQHWTGSENEFMIAASQHVWGNWRIFSLNNSPIIPLYILGILGSIRRPPAHLRSCMPAMCNVAQDWTRSKNRFTILGSQHVWGNWRIFSLIIHQLSHFTIGNSNHQSQYINT